MTELGKALLFMLLPLLDVPLEVLFLTKSSVKYGASPGAGEHW
jgi:hypothetical protein